jgi:hypothetical protein
VRRPNTRPGASQDYGLDVERAHTNVEVVQLVDRGLHRLCETVEGALSDPMQPFVGLQPDEQPVLPRVPHHVCIYARDQYGRVSSLAIAAVPNMSAPPSIQLPRRLLPLTKAFVGNKHDQPRPVMPLFRAVPDWTFAHLIASVDHHLYFD